MRLKNFALCLGVAFTVGSARAQLISLDSDPGQFVLQPAPVLTPESGEGVSAPTETTLDEEKAKELDRAKLQRDYQVTLTMLEEQKAEEMHKAEVEKQAAGFSREFFKLDMYSDDFAGKFEALEKKYPLANEDPLAARLFEKSRKQISRRQAQPAEAGTQPAD